MKLALQIAGGIVLAALIVMGIQNVQENIREERAMHAFNEMLRNTPKVPNTTINLAPPTTPTTARFTPPPTPPGRPCQVTNSRGETFNCYRPQ